MTANFTNRTLWTGDNLDIMRGLNSESVDLIYLDPPFNSNQEYSAPIGSEAAGAAFKDTWTLNDVDLAWHGLIAEEHPGLYRIIDAAGAAHGKGMKSYLIMMGVRLLEIHRVLKVAGAVYLHCDDTASHYLKMLMDSVFGDGNFKNEISWQRFNFHADAKRFGRVCDRILFYTKSQAHNFNRLRVPFSEQYVSSKFTHQDPNGRRFRLDNLNPPAGRGPVYEFHGVTKAWRFTEEKMLALESEGRIYTQSRVPQLKRFLDELDGQAVHDNWHDIPPINSRAKERTGYPTQKPLALLERIIKASSNEGDVVLDPFCGCATALIAAEKLERQWVGIDISPAAKRLVKSRMERELGLFGMQAIYRDDIPQRTDMGKLPSPQTHKHTLYGVQEGVCIGCKIMFPFKNMTIDHIVPQSKGGSDHIENLQLLCGACNSMKGTKSQAEFLAALAQAGG
ncbi:MAG: DNA methyltransferase [Chloroflexi bacterium]|nr:DNA methyltransferase [Chloroflexota bacterium]